MIKYTDNESNFIRRFRSLALKWEATEGTEEARNRIRNLLTGDFHTFQETTRQLLEFGGFSSFAHYKRGYLEYIDLANSMGECTDCDERKNYVEEITKSRIWNAKGEVRPEWRENTSGEPIIEEPEPDIVSYVASPEHLVYLLGICYGENPDSVCAMFCLLWTGIRVTHITELLKSDIAEDCTSCTVDGQTYEIPEPLAAYLKQYRENSVEYSIGKRYKILRYKDGKYFIERPINNRNMAILDEPITPYTLYKGVASMNEDLTKFFAKQHVLTIENIRRSALYYKTYKEIEGTKIPPVDVLRVRANIGGHVLYEHVREYQKWLAVYEKVTAEFPEFK